MADIRILLGNEPRAYRDALATATLAQRPGLEVQTVNPSQLDRMIEYLAPHLVICSWLEPASPVVPGWVVLYPNGSSTAMITIAGERDSSQNADFESLLAIIDRVQVLVHQAAL